jgi:hypothetical protein
VVITRRSCRRPGQRTPFPVVSVAGAAQLGVRTHKMESILGHKSGMLMVAGAALTSWRLSSYGKDKIDRAVLRFLFWFLFAAAFVWLVSPLSSNAASVALVMVGCAFFILLIGGVPGLRVSLPTDARHRIVKEQIILWAAVIIVVIAWQKLT